MEESRKEKRVSYKFLTLLEKRVTFKIPSRKQYTSYIMKDYKLCKMEMLLIVPKHAVKENGKYISKELLML